VQGSTGAPLKRLEPQPGFGLFLWHDGALTGWRNQFKGSTITELAPNYFRVSAPTGGTVKVQVTISACEKANCADLAPPPPRLWLWLLLGLLLLLVIGFLIWKLK